MEISEHPDWALVIGLGGPTKVADLLGLPKDGGVQRVQNWKFRGIPSAVKVEWPDLFMKAAVARATTAPAAINSVAPRVDRRVSTTPNPFPDLDRRAATQGVT